MEKLSGPLPVKGAAKRVELADFIRLNRHREDKPNKWELYEEWRNLRDQKAAALREIRRINKQLGY